MRHKKKGRRIYTYRARNRRIFSPYHPMRTALGSVFTLLLTAFLGVVGYSIIGPVVTRMQAEELNPTTTPNPYFDTADVIAETETTAPAPETTAPPKTTTPAATTTTTTTTTPPPLQTRFPEGVSVSFATAADVLSDLDTLDKAAGKYAKQGYTGLFLPLKTEGGSLMFSTENEKARTCGATTTDKLTLREICNALKRWDMDCSAELNLFEDHLYPSVYNDGAYTFLDGQTRWLDASSDEGGKPWLSPFAEGARAYLCDIAGELEAAGIHRILCTGLVFPHFYDSDIAYLGTRVQNVGERLDALTSTVNQIARTAPAAGVYFDLTTVLSGNAEGFDTGMLTTGCAYLRIDPADFSAPFQAGGERYDPSSLSFADRSAMLIKAARSVCGAMKLCPVLVKGNLSEGQLDTLVSAAAEAGCLNIIVTE